jgi:rhodanese-related sulfurtransferase
LTKNTYRLPFWTALLQTLMLVLTFSGNAGAHGTNDKGHISPSGLTAASKRFFIIDLRSPELYRKAHVPGAVSLPLEDLSQKRLQDLGLTKDKPVVLYDTSESAARKGKVLLEVLGFSDLRILAGGFTHWLEDRQPEESGESGPTVGKKVKTVKAGLEIKPQVHDFGVIRKENGVVSTTFTVNNTGDEKIDIAEITTSCGCTSAKMDKRKLAPGESGTVTVFFDPDFHKEPEGRFSRTVFLQTSGGEEFQARIMVQIAQ